MWILRTIFAAPNLGQFGQLCLWMIICLKYITIFLYYWKHVSLRSLSFYFQNVFGQNMPQLPLHLRISKMARVAVTTTPRHNSVSTSRVSVEILGCSGCSMFNRVTHVSRHDDALPTTTMSMKIRWRLPLVRLAEERHPLPTAI